MRKEEHGRAGFSLLEVVLALAILSTALFVLLQAHSGALSLFTGSRDEVFFGNLVERALGEAELAVMTGTLSGSGDFGARYPGCSYSFTAALLDDEGGMPLYQVDTSIETPEISRSLTTLVYVMGPPL